MFKNNKILVVFVLALLVALGQSKHCFEKQFGGLTTTVSLVAYNALNEQSPSTPLSFFEASTLSVDFVGQRLGIYYTIVIDGQNINGQLIALGGSVQAMYVIQNGSCSQLPLSIEIPTGYNNLNLTDNGEVEIGKYEVTSYEQKGDVIDTVIFYDNKKCAVVSIGTGNVDQQNQGYLLGNYFYFKNHATESFFDVPSICSSSTTRFIHKNPLLKRQNLVLPQSIHSLLKL